MTDWPRLAVLRAWGSIAERGALPRMRFLVAARLGRDRLHDQSSLVRKEAIKVSGARGGRGGHIDTGFVPVDQSWRVCPYATEYRAAVVLVVDLWLWLSV